MTNQQGTSEQCNSLYKGHRWSNSYCCEKPLLHEGHHSYRSSPTYEFIWPQTESDRIQRLEQTIADLRADLEALQDERMHFNVQAVQEENTDLRTRLETAERNAKMWEADSVRQGNWGADNAERYRSQLLTEQGRVALAKVRAEAAERLLEHDRETFVEDRDYWQSKAEAAEKALADEIATSERLAHRLRKAEQRLAAVEAERDDAIELGQAHEGVLHVDQDELETLRAKAALGNAYFDWRQAYRCTAGAWPPMTDEESQSKYRQAAEAEIQAQRELDALWLRALTAKTADTEGEGNE